MFIFKGVLRSAAAFLAGSAFGFFALLGIAILRERARVQPAGYNSMLIAIGCFPFPGILGAFCGVVTGSILPRKRAIWRAGVYGALPWMALAVIVISIAKGDVPSDSVLLMVLFILSGAVSGMISAGIRGPKGERQD